jgi:hypothetical protein
MPGHATTPNIGSFDNCDNPTYHNNHDYLTEGAPQPSPCDYVTAPLNCVVVNGKPVSAGGNGSGGSGNGSGGSGAGGAGNGNAGNPAAGASATASAGAGASFNPVTGQYAGATSSANSAQNINAEPVAVAGRPNEETLLSTLTVLELLAAVSAPVLVGAWVHRRRKRG